MSSKNEKLIPQERWFIQIADRVLPPLFIIIAAVIIFTAQKKIAVGILCLLFLLINLIISEINRKSRLKHEDFINALRIGLTGPVGFLIVMFAGVGSPSWLIALPMIFGTPYAFRRLWLSFLCLFFFILTIAAGSMYIGKPPVEIAAFSVCFIFMAITGVFAVFTLNKKELELLKTNTILKEDEEQLTEANKALIKFAGKLKSKNEEIVDFVNFVAHDLRNPLTGITSTLTIIKEDESLSLDDEVDQLVGLSYKSARYMQELIDDLADIARLDAGTLSLDFEQVEVSEVVRTTLERLQQKVDEMDITVSSDVDAVLRGNKKGLTKVFTNLVENAINYMGTPERPQISIASRRTNDTYRFFVKDNGAGIPRNSEKIIFEKFKRGKETASEIRGTGLGLAIAKAVVEAHGGRIWVENKIGEGATFCFELPENGPENFNT